MKINCCFALIRRHEIIKTLNYWQKICFIFIKFVPKKALLWDCNAISVFTYINT